MLFSRTQIYLVVGVLGLAIIVGVVWYLGQPFPKPAKPFVVVLPMWDAPPGRPATEGFVNKIKELGYKEGVDVVYKRHGFFPPGPETFEKIKGIYESDLADGVDLIVTIEYSDAKAAQEVTQATGKLVPIVFVTVTGDPVESGFVKDWSFPGFNLTGVAEERDVVVEKALDLFTTIVPGIKKIGAGAKGFMLPVEPSPSYYEALLEQAKKRGIEIVEYTTDVPPGPGHKEEIIRIFNNIKEGEIDAWAHIPGHFFANQQAIEHQTALRLKIPHWLPAVEHDDETGELVGFFAYGADFAESGKQAAVFADKILRGGASPSEIPLEFPYKYKIMINLKTAEKIGLTVAPEILEIADIIVE